MMSNEIPIIDMDLAHEGVDLECKKAAGRDGRGAVPIDFWETYSAMANTDGGVVLLGVQQKGDNFIPVHIAEPERVLKDLYDTANNPGKVSINLLNNDSGKVFRTGDGKVLISVKIPRATRQQRPVFLNGNPLGNTYVRLRESDQRLGDDAVKRMLAEQQEDSRDTRILKGYGVEDLCQDTLRVYRQVFSNRQPRHPWNELGLKSFLHNIGGMRKDRASGEEGLTVAGLLMFGTHPVIQEEFPFYMLDYQERPEARAEKRWVDRVTLDGTWSGNLYDFYRKVYPRLIENLKVPFELVKGERRDETPAHEALREALCNMLVHADYSDRCSVLVVKRPDLFGFRNPGLMRVPLEYALQGGHADCRNRILHQMFRHVGIGDQSGSGIPTILAGWKKHHWRQPALEERREPSEQSLLTMRMVDIFPAETDQQLNDYFGEVYQSLSYLERLALAVAAVESTVTNSRLAAVSGEHPADCSRSLQNLLNRQFLEKTGRSRGSVYHLTGRSIPGPEDVFDAATFISSQGMGSDSQGMGSDSQGIDAESTGLIEGSRESMGGLVVARQFDRPFIHDLSSLSPELLGKLEGEALRARDKRRLHRKEMEEIIRHLCARHYITLGCLSELLNRNPEFLRTNYLNPMKKSGVLKIAFERSPNHPKQAYTLTDI